MRARIYLSLLCKKNENVQSPVRPGNYFLGGPGPAAVRLIPSLPGGNPNEANSPNWR